MQLLRMGAVLGLVVAPWLAVSAQITTASASRADGSASSTPGVSVVVGTVFDSVANAPLERALIQMAAEAGAKRVYATTTDSTGAYRIEGVPSGSYLITFFHPALDHLGLRASLRRVQVAGDSLMRLDYAIPPARTVRAAICAPTALSDSSGLLIGRVHNADTGAPLAGDIVTVTWHELVIDQHGVRPQTQQLSGRSNGDGLYAICGVPTETPVLARAEQGAASSGFIELRVPPQGLLQRDFGIGSLDSMGVATSADSTQNTIAPAGSSVLWRGTASLAGWVRAASGEPMPDVQLFVRGSIEHGASDAQGHFALSNLPPGTFTLEARRVGFAPKRIAIDLASHRTTTVTVTLDKHIAVLNTVTVYGKAQQRSSSMTGFLNRARAGFGYFVTPAEINTQQAIYLSDLFRRIPGVGVVPVGSFGHALVVRGGHSTMGQCQPVVYLDGMRAFIGDDSNIDDIVSPEDVAAIEMYNGAAGTPAQFSGNGCGVALVWTKGGF